MPDTPHEPEDSGNQTVRGEAAANTPQVLESLDKQPVTEPEPIQPPLAEKADDLETTRDAVANATQVPGSLGKPQYLQKLHRNRNCLPWRRRRTIWKRCATRWSTRLGSAVGFGSVPVRAVLPPRCRWWGDAPRSVFRESGNDAVPQCRPPAKGLLLAWTGAVPDRAYLHPAASQPASGQSRGARRETQNPNPRRARAGGAPTTTAEQYFCATACRATGGAHWGFWPAPVADRLDQSDRRPYRPADAPGKAVWLASATRKFLEYGGVRRLGCFARTRNDGKKLGKVGCDMASRYMPYRVWKKARWVAAQGLATMEKNVGRVKVAGARAYPPYAPETKRLSEFLIEQKKTERGGMRKGFSTLRCDH